MGLTLVWTDEPPSFSAWLGEKPIWRFDEGRCGVGASKLRPMKSRLWNDLYPTIG